ncbi:MAG: aminotransferase class V-fold PLP-dependent enzyme [Nitriliruptorales bacterium]
MKAHFSRFLESDPDRLHVAAHSHHPWPDVSFEAQQRAWLDAAELHDRKWDKVFGEVIPAFQGHVARRLGLPDPATVTVAPNTHSLVVRLLSCLPTPTRILTTDTEFHSFDRQSRRLEEDALAAVTRVPLEPFATFPQRFGDVLTGGGHDLVFLSHVPFDSACIVPDLAGLVAAVPDDETFVMIDGYHGFMAVPTDLSTIADRSFYLAGGYKYAMAGEGAVFMHCPPGYGERPVDTGWYAGFWELEERGGAAPRGGEAGPDGGGAPDQTAAQDGGRETQAGGREQVAYGTGGARFLGATFDPSGLYRFNAVQTWLDAVGLDVTGIHSHVRALQEQFLQGLEEAGLGALPADRLVPGRREVADRGHFLAFAVPDAAGLDAALAERGVVVDHRGDRIRFGFGIYHDAADVDALLVRLATLT